MSKKRPSVDPSVFDLAQTWVTENYALDPDSADAKTDSVDDVVWDLADTVQNQLEAWLDYSVRHGRLRLLRDIEVK